MKMFPGTNLIFMVVSPLVELMEDQLQELHSWRSQPSRSVFTMLQTFNKAAGLKTLTSLRWLTLSVVSVHISLISCMCLAARWLSGWHCHLSSWLGQGLSVWSLHVLPVQLYLQSVPLTEVLARTWSWSPGVVLQLLNAPQGWVKCRD